MNKLLGILIVINSVNFAFAEGNSTIDQIEKTYSSCMENAASTADYNDCIGKAYDAADAELNKVYQSIKAPLKGQKDADSVETLKRLVAAQKAWVTFKDTNCSLAGVQMLNGSGEGPIVGGCLVDTTIARVRELQNIFDAR